MTTHGCMCSSSVTRCKVVHDDKYNEYNILLVKIVKILSLSLSTSLSLSLSLSLNTFTFINTVRRLFLFYPKNCIELVSFTGVLFSNYTTIM